MNKRFSTLLAAALVAGGLSASAQYVPTGGHATAIKPTVNYYHIQIKDAAVNSYLGATTRDGKDSLYLMSPVKGDFQNASALDSAMWQVDLSVETDSVFSFVNKITNAKLSFAKEGTGMVADGISKWAWKGTDGGYITNGSSFRLDTLSSDIKGIPAGTVILSKDGKFNDKVDGVVATEWMIVDAGTEVKLSADDLNSNDGGYFKLAFGAEVAGNVFTANKLEAVAVSGTQAKAANVANNEWVASNDGFTPSDSVMLRVIGAKGENSQWTGKANDTLFVVTDTLHYAPNGGSNWSAQSGYKFVLDTLTNETNEKAQLTAGSDTIAAEGRNISSYLFAFKVYKNRIAGDSLVIGSNASVTYEKDNEGHTDYIYKKGTQPVLVNVSTDNTGAKIVTTLGGTSAASLPLIEFPQGTKFTGLDATKKYFILYTGGNNKDKYYVVVPSADNEGAVKYEAAASPLVPSTQWAVKKLASGNYTIFNREFDGVKFLNGKAIYEAGDAGYKISADDKNTFKFVEVGATDEYVGYKYFKDADLANLSVSLNFNTTFGDDVPVYMKDKDSILYAAKGETAISFKLAKANAGAATYGDDLKRQSYILKEFLGNRVLGIDAAGNLKLTNRTKQYVANDIANRDTVAVLLRATSVANKYQLVVLKGKGQTTNDALTFESGVLGSDSLVATAGGTEGKLFTDKLGSLLTGSFSVEFPDLPDFVNVTKDKPAHMVIRSTANNSLAITMGAKGAALLKSTSDLKADSYSEDNLKMYVDTAKMTDAAKPTYYIRTTQGVDSEDVEAGVANYLSIKDGKVSFVAGKQFGLNGVDSLLVGNDKEYAPKAQFLFANTKTEGQYKIYNAASNKYLAQKNGVIVVADVDDAFPFTTEVVDTPTGNESTEANTISVVAGEGNVTVYGAAGKKVIVSNVLGQKTTIVATSDSEVIAAPQGVVIVAVEGEAAVKAVVK
ncbi:DUF6383 domain-containing protein [Parabacteroides chinchillae]|uniref:DUF6383 domain-containing protein n=1 Tax=Parabacteroides chinchillae TaxID=871327 RepID=A0A8G2BV67_9BACT|nr:DUF6383 domain-containing protein [Parabacteroides chinchillae]SEF59527.1 hypothetical protein SAMN05444001_10356 [Parabacteroides chinchillae]